MGLGFTVSSLWFARYRTVIMPEELQKAGAGAAQDVQPRVHRQHVSVANVEILVYRDRT